MKLPIYYKLYSKLFNIDFCNASPWKSACNEPYWNSIMMVTSTLLTRRKHTSVSYIMQGLIHSSIIIRYFFIHIPQGYFTGTGTIVRFKPSNVMHGWIPPPPPPPPPQKKKKKKKYYYHLSISWPHIMSASKRAATSWVVLQVFWLIVVPCCRCYFPISVYWLGPCSTRMDNTFTTIWGKAN